ncbi:MAG TPA: signal peptidase II [Mycobacteriales bacterium]|jgi:lipoprotein signal peptidase|nr:signal peptidase II [Mycobacteriales bacterium]
MHRHIAVANRPRMSPRTPLAARFRRQVGQRYFVLGALATVVLVDQGSKWWGWRNTSGVHVNYGGDDLLPAAAGSLYAHPVAGALLDLIDSVLLISAIFLFLRRRRSTPMLITGSLTIGGWSSDLLDRLAMHYWTAPGSVRGVVDFIPIGHSYYNVADLCIIMGTPLFLLAMTGPALRTFAMKRPVIATRVTPRMRRPWRARSAMWLGAAVVLMVIVGAGAVNFGGVTAPATSTGIRYQPSLVTHQGTAYDISLARAPWQRTPSGRRV